MAHRSIKDRIRRAKSNEVRREVLTDWAANWRSDQEDIVRQFERAVSRRDYDALASLTGQLKAVTEKRFEGLASVIDALTEADDG